MSKNTPQIQPDNTTLNPEEIKGQPLVSHLIELRNRLLRVVIVVIIIFAGLFYFSNDLYSFVSEPLRKFMAPETSMIATQVASPFLAPFKLTVFASVFISMPYILFQAWGFISPGLYGHEKRFALPLLASSILLFYCGIAFAYYVVFPIIFEFFNSVGPTEITVMTDINSYLDFILKLFFAFGITFEIPIATVLLVWTGIADVKTLSQKRPYIIVGCFIIGMLLTPPDVISQSLLAIPMWLLFEIGILFARLLRGNTRKDLDKNDEQEGEAAQ